MIPVNGAVFTMLVKRQLSLVAAAVGMIVLGPPADAVSFGTVAITLAIMMTDHPLAQDLRVVFADRLRDIGAE